MHKYTILEAKTLPELYEEKSGKVSLKWDLYLEVYDRILAPFQNTPVNILEIGVQNGGSLEVWGQYFIVAKQIVGIDNDPKCRTLSYADERITVIIGDCCQPDVLEQISHTSVTFDLIFDDGSHQSSDIIKTFLLYFPKLSVEGLYIIEDLHCSYWTGYEGGLFDPYSSIAFIKRLIDLINHQHWQNGLSVSQFLEDFLVQSRLDPLPIDLDSLYQIHSIELINSLCIIKKKATKNNTINEIIIRGSDDSIEPKPIKETMEEIITLQNQSENIFSSPTFKNSADISSKLSIIRNNLISSLAIVQEKEQNLATLRKENYELHKKLYEVTTELNKSCEGILSLNLDISSLRQENYDIHKKLYEVTTLLIKKTEDSSQPKESI